MELTKEIKWLCENARSLEKFSGQWVMFSTREGVVSNGPSLQKVLNASKKMKPSEKPFVFHVPSKEELGSPVLVAKFS